MAEPAQSQSQAPNVVRMPINPAQVQSVGIGGVQFNTQTILQSPFFWICVGAGAAWLIVYSINRQKAK